MSEQTNIVVLINIIILFDDCSHSYFTNELGEINKKVFAQDREEGTQGI